MRQLDRQELPRVRGVLDRQTPPEGCQPQHGQRVPDQLRLHGRLQEGRQVSLQLPNLEILILLHNCPGVPAGNLLFSLPAVIERIKSTKMSATNLED